MVRPAAPPSPRARGGAGVAADGVGARARASFARRLRGRVSIDNTGRFVSLKPMRTTRAAGATALTAAPTD